MFDHRTDVPDRVLRGWFVGLALEAQNRLLVEARESGKRLAPVAHREDCACDHCVPHVLLPGEVLL